MASGQRRPSWHTMSLRGQGVGATQDYSHLRKAGWVPSLRLAGREVKHLHTVGQGGLPRLNLGVPILHPPCDKDSTFLSSDCWCSV